jgi:glycosyltransferase involved in cell wall biosynthesis
MKILLVTQMWPSDEHPDLGSFLVPVARELEALGHEVKVSSISKRGGGPAKYAALCADAVRAARRLRPDVVFGHFLFPAGAAAAFGARAAGAPLVLMAHGQDVSNLETMEWVRRPTRTVLGRASALIVNSRWLGELLDAALPGAAPAKREVIDCGVDLKAFAPLAAAEARTRVGWDGDGPAFLCLGSLIDRKNVVALADAFATLGRGRLAFVGDGPLRAKLEGHADVTLVGRVEHGRVPDWIAACDVLCQPSLREPFGQAALEAMAMERSVVATRIGGPQEFITDATGVLVDPADPAALAQALERAASLPTPNPAAREAAAEHDVVRQAARMASVLEAAVASFPDSSAG